MTTDQTPDAESEQHSESTERPRNDETERDSESTERIPDAGSEQQGESTDRTPDAETEQDSELLDSESLVAVLAYALRVTVRFLVIGTTLALAGLRIGIAYVRDDSNQRRARRWLLLEGDRWTIITVLVAGIFVGSLTLGLTNVIGVRESSFVTTMFSTIIAGLFSFIPLVIAVNQLTVTRLFGTPDHLRDRVDGVHEFRRGIETLSNDADVSPTDPAAFLRLVARAMGDRAVALQSATAETDDPVRSEIDEFAESVAEQSDRLIDRLDGRDLNVFAALLPVINDNYSKQFNQSRRLRVRFDGALPAEVDDRLEELQSTLVSVDVTRQYFKIIYLQQELAELSRLLAYSGTAAFLTSTLVVMIYASGYPPAISETALLLLVTLSLAVAFSPLAILFAFVVRVATIIKRTSAPGAFTPKGERPSYAR
jgi:hypothetical protein